ncbi:uncharacterized protein Dmul_04110 [Desulfococcus multivorans]|nr:uncharacterized protein Dmul_04110 [Desulfococcus multivorans]
MTVTDVTAPYAKCSTPFGIGDRCGDSYGRNRPVRQVLNAFRHRRSVRRRDGTPGSNDLECSTPFGIGDRCGDPPVVRAGVWYECSTPFGIGDRCGIPTKFSLGIHISAQRLSASEIGAEALITSIRIYRTCAQRLSASEIGAV